MRVAIAGAVRSSRRVLAALLEHGLDVVGVFGHMPADLARVSGHVSLEPLAREGGVPFHPFRHINDELETIRALAPDLLFVVGLSQLVSREIIDIPRHGCVGFHPTRLPERRGRAPIAWLVLEQADGAANFFRLGDGADDGPIYASAPFEVTAADDAEDISGKIGEAIDRALAEWLPRLAAGDLSATEQDASLATWRGRRGPEDGLIDWHADAETVVRLVRASARPHPGAFTHVEDTRLIVWRASVVPAPRTLGVVGRILELDGDGDGEATVARTGRAASSCSADAGSSASRSTRSPRGTARRASGCASATTPTASCSGCAARWRR